jgi:hypothetical protein
MFTGQLSFFDPLASGSSAKPMVSLDQFSGRRGLLVALIDDVGHPMTGRRIQWLQRHSGELTKAGVPLAVVLHNQPHTLANFRSSCPMSLSFPMLADPAGCLRKHFSLSHHATLLLFDHSQKLRDQWEMHGVQLWPRMAVLEDAVATL